MKGDENIYFRDINASGKDSYVSYLERKADNNTSDIESIYGILQDMEHRRLFGF